jgi:hypothetical protein
MQLRVRRDVSARARRTALCTCEKRGTTSPDTGPAKGTADSIA